MSNQNHPLPEAGSRTRAGAVPTVLQTALGPYENTAPDFCWVQSGTVSADVVRYGGPHEQGREITAPANIIVVWAARFERATIRSQAGGST